MELGGKAPDRAACDMVGHVEVGIVGRVISHNILGHIADRALVRDRDGYHWGHSRRVAEHLYVLGTVDLVDAVVIASNKVGNAASVAEQ